MKGLPTVTDRDEFDALIIRTDFRDEQSWQVGDVGIGRAMGGDGAFEPHVRIVTIRCGPRRPSMSCWLRFPPTKT